MKIRAVKHRGLRLPEVAEAFQRVRRYGFKKTSKRLPDYRSSLDNSSSKASLIC